MGSGLWLTNFDRRDPLTIEAPVAGFAEWQIKPAVAAGLEQLGWRDDESAVRDVVPTVLRGGNVVAVLPAGARPGPIRSWRHCSARSRPRQAPVLVLAAPASVGEWAVAVGAVTESDPHPDRCGPRGSRCRRPAPAFDQTDVLIASPATALDRHARSALHPEQFRAIVFAWPEEWQADDAVAALLQDFPKRRPARSCSPRVATGSTAPTASSSATPARRWWSAARQRWRRGFGNAARETSVRTVPTSWAGARAHGGRGDRGDRSRRR